METRETLSRREKAGLVWRFLQPQLWFFVGAVAFGCLGMGLNALLPQIVRFAVDGVLGAGEPDLPEWLLTRLSQSGLLTRPMRALWYSALAVVGTAVLRELCTYLQKTNQARGSEGFVKAIRDSLFAHTQKMSFQWHTAHATGDVIQRCTSDVDVIRSFVCNQLMEVLRISFLLVLDLAIMFSMQWKLALITALFVPFMATFSGVFYQRISARFQKADEAEGVLTTCVQENLTGVRVVRAFGRERYEIRKFREKNNAFADLWIRLDRLLSVYWATGDLLSCFQVMTMILIGTVETVHGNLSLGTFLAFLFYNAALTWPIRSLGRVLADMSKAGVSMERVGSILLDQEEQDAPDAREASAAGDIVFDHVTFGYGGQTVLRDLSFTIPKGSTFAVLGGTGSGKSTLVHLLDRLYDLEEGQGRITINGVELRQFRRDCLRRQVGLVLQEPFLFSRTIGENIAATRPEATQEEIRRAAALACVDEAIAEFPQGYDTLVGERGVTLSGGQKQRVAIARMLLQQAPILIFDDSLSAVDAETDTKIRRALKENRGEATMILISHRVTTLMQADQILVLEDGRAADLGTHQELISRPGLYRDIYNIQMQQDDRMLLEQGGEDHDGN